MEFLDLLFSAAGGGVLGLLGTGVKLFAEHKKEELRIQEQQILADKMARNMELEIKLAESKGAIDLELQESTNDAQALQRAIEAEGNISNVHTWVNDVRAMVRPVLTVTLTIMAYLKPNEDDIVWMASTAVTFWFGDRPRKKK